MRRKIGILVCLLWVTISAFAVGYQPCGGASFGSTSAYVSTRQISCSRTPYTVHQSASAISVSNFNTLNSEGGACYHPSAINGGPRRGKITEPGTEAVGEGVWESPVGEIPFILMAILASLYVIWTKKRKKVQKNLVVS